LRARPSSIIKVRRSQRNFQMVIITHDEEFVRYLNRADCAEFFYRVTRDEKYAVRDVQVS
jgi:DNA repair protein RAD50